jgi:AcrR family transcriptional regulator
MPAPAKSRIPKPAAVPPKRRGGRPSRSSAAQLRERILEAATDLLLGQGYGATSIEAVAIRAGVSKRTFYHRFPDKPALLGAVVAHIIDGLRPGPDTPLVAGRNLEEILVHLAGLILHSALDPKALGLHRLIVAESSRFPDLAAAVARAGGRSEAVSLIGALLARHAPDAVREKGAAAFAAEQFLQLVVSLPQLRAMGMGKPLSAREVKAWPRRSVALFLGGFGRTP